MDKRELLITATIDLAAEIGLNNFSMRQVTERAGTSDALIYKHFSSKEELFFNCFETIDRKIAAIFDNLPLPQANRQQSPEELYTNIRLYWMMYFNYLVSSGNETLFYFAYRDSGYFKEIQDHNQISKNSYFRGFTNIVYSMDTVLHFREKISNEYLWVYILDTTGFFAKRVIRGEFPNTPQSTEMIWKLISAGLMGPVQS